MSERLKPCPFCGAPAGEVAHHITPIAHPGKPIIERRSVQCSRIFHGCQGNGPIKGSEDEAIAAWNNRPATNLTVWDNSKPPTEKGQQ